MKKAFFVFLILAGLAVKSQSYSISNINKVVNGNSVKNGELKGVPGDLFAATLTFSNSSSAPVSVFIDRYQKTLPSYWYSCFCYFQCNNPSRDTISIEIDPMSTRDLTVQFKTDSVNPGLATSTFKIYQYGFQNNYQTLHLDASTMSDVGIKELSKASNLTVYPNPAHSILTVNTSIGIIKSVSVLSILGEKLVEQSTGQKIEETIDISQLPNGPYLLQIVTDDGVLNRRIIKQ